MPPSYVPGWPIRQCREGHSPVSGPVPKLVGGQLDAFTAIELGQSGADVRLVFSRGPDELRIRSRA
jgi:hypothetical protein